mmetsp:Transcript_49838/g.131726  ORF Transcript_49838/g.131726 Transcript_49838/m.131726 type:complete len:822 (-) Transcript_49838:39-2504(-)
MALFAEMLSFAVELLHPMLTEVFMFGLAAIVYVLFTGGLSSVLVFGKQSTKAKVVAAAEPRPRPTAPSASHAEAACQPALHALRKGLLGEALERCAQLPQPLPLPLATRALVALGRSSKLTDDVMDKLMNMPGAFSSVALEAAAAEAQKSRNVNACRQLYQVAGLASIPKTERAIDALVRGLASDAAAMRALVEEVTAEGSGISLSKPFVDSLAALCASAPIPAARRSSPQPGDLMKHAKAISAFGKEGNLRAATALFEQLKRTGAPMNPLIYNCLLEACVQCNDLQAARKHFERMKGEGLADVVSYNTVMKGYLSGGDLEGAHRLLKDMAKDGVAANRITYHGLLNVMVLRGDTSGIWRLTSQMKEEGLSANAVTCSILLKAVTSRLQATGLTRVLKLMDEDEVPVDEVLFASVVEACVRTGSLDVLSERMRAYASQGGLAKLSAPTYGSMIKAYGQARNVERIWELWTEMSKRQVTPTSITLGCMVDALVTNHHVEDAWRLVQGVWEDPEQRALVNNVIYSTILKGFAMTRQHDKVTTLYEEMKKRDIQRNTITYNTILNSIARCGLMHRAGELLEDMRAAEIEPDLVTYSTIIKGYCQCGDLDKSLQLLQEMRKEARITPDEVMYNSLLDGCARQHRLDDALRLLDEMRDAGVAPSNYTLSILSKLLGRARRLSKALTMVETISKEYGFQPNIQVYTCLMQACFHNRQLGMAVQLHDKIVREGILPDERTYTVLVRGFLQAGATDKAAEVLRCAFHLPGHGLLQAPGSPAGVDACCSAEVLSALGTRSAAASSLEADLASVSRAGPRQAGPRPWARRC